MVVTEWANREHVDADYHKE